MPVGKLNFVSDEQIVLRLFNNWLDQPVFLANHVSLCNIFSIPLTSTPVENVTFSNSPIESSASLLHGCIIIWPVAKHHIDIVKA